MENEERRGEMSASASVRKNGFVSAWCMEEDEDGRGWDEAREKRKGRPKNVQVID